MTGIILSGGKATRMGGAIDKAFLKIDGEPVITRQLKVFKKIFKEIIIVTNTIDRYSDIKDVIVISDAIPDRGPLGGIYSGLLASKSFHNFIVACDMPFINERLIGHMIKNKNNYDIVIPKIDEKFHPLFGIYSKDCVSVIKEMLEHNRLRISNIFTKVKTHFISKNVIEKFDENILSLININTVEDLATVDIECYTG